MSVHRITRFVFWLDGVVVTADSGHKIQPGMAGVLDALHHRFELWLVSDYPSHQTADVVSENALARWFADEDIYSLPGPIVDHHALLQSLVEAGVIIPGQSLWVDHHPKRTMFAVRQGIDATIFVDSERLYRDLWLWSIVPLHE